MIQRHLFLTLVLGVKGKASRSDRLTPGKEPQLPIERGLRDGLDVAENKKICYSIKSNIVYPFIHVVT